MAVSEEESSPSSSTTATTTSSSSLKSRFPQSNGVHYLAKCVLRGSVVLHVVHGHLRSPSSYDVVFGKETSIELVAVGEDGVVQSVCEQPVFGIINNMAVLPWNEKLRSENPQTIGKDVLVVASDSGKLSFLTFSNEMHRFFPLTHVHLSGPGNSLHQSGRMLAVDSSGCYIAVGAFDEHVTLFSVSASSNFDMIDKRVRYPADTEDELMTSGFQPANESVLVSSLSAESIGANSDRDPLRPCTSGTIWSMCFISKSSNQLNKGFNPVLAILVNRKGSSLNELVLLEWDLAKNSVHVLSRFIEGGSLALKIAEVPGCHGLALLFREGDILLLDFKDVCNPTCVQRLCLSSSVSMVDEHDSMEDSFRLHDDDEGFIAARALLELQDYGMDLSKGDDPMSIDSDICSTKSVLKCECPCSWEPGAYLNPRMVFAIDSGEIFLIEITVDIDGTNMTLSNCLYKGHSFNTLLWTESGFVAAIVDMGDGVVLKFEEGKLEFSSAIQNIAPILDMSVMDYHNEKHDQMFACCGKAPEGSLRIIRNGISVERLLRTAPIYQGITAIWTLKMRLHDLCHSFVVLSFVEETRVLSVGVSFTDVTDSVGFLPDVCTLACGLVTDGVLVQIDHSAVRLCLPTEAAHSAGIPMTSPTCTSWSPKSISISLGSVGPNIIVVATSNPFLLIILGVKSVSLYSYEVYEMHQVRLHSELSCISVPQMHCSEKGSLSLPLGVDIGKIFVIGTHKPSVEIVSFANGQGMRVLATGTISLTSTTGIAVGGCIPQDVRLVMVDRLYVLSGLRNGMLLRFEWPTVSWASDFPSRRTSLFAKPDLLRTSSPAIVASQLCSAISFEKPKDEDPIHLQLIAVRRIGITPVFLVPLTDSLDADIIALSDRPWLVQAARQSLSYISISFEPSTYVTPVCSAECPKGLLFVAENCLHLVEMVHSKRLNVQKFHLGGTPRKVLYHSESRLLLVLRTELGNESFSSDICCVDPLSGSVLSAFKFTLGETGKSMELIKVGKEQLLVVGTSLSSGPSIMSTGEAESTKGRLIVLCLEHSQNADSGSVTICSEVGQYSQQISRIFGAGGYSAELISRSSCCSSPDDNVCDGVKLEDGEAWRLRLCYSSVSPGAILAICPYLENYFLASSGNAFYVCGFLNDNPRKVRRYAVERTRFTIVSLTAYFTTIVVGDCRDGVLFYSYHEEAKKLEQMYCDPGQRLIADCLLTEPKTAFVSDRKGSFAILTSSTHSEDNLSPECNLTLSCIYHMGEISMSIKKGSFSYKLPADDGFKGCATGNDKPHYSIMAGTLLGSIVIFIPMSRDEYELLKVVQARLAVHPLTAPILGNNHNEFRSRENKVSVPTILDGDMLAQFLELTSIQQEAVLALPCATAEVSSSLRSSHSAISANHVVQLLERVHYALN